MNMKAEFNEFPDWVCWLAQDANGIWWGYEVEPNMSHNGWYENEVGRSVEVYRIGELGIENVNAWKHSVCKVK